MEKGWRVQGRVVTFRDLQTIRELIEGNPGWHRTRLSRELCARWGWNRANGAPKDMACRTLLLKLERRGLLRLPARRAPSVNGFRNRSIRPVPHATDPIVGALGELQPIEVRPVQDHADQALFACLIARYHYLGYRGTVGESLKYLALDRRGRPLACLLFGSAAWKVASRDAFIGWSLSVRRGNLPYVTNNMRFLVVPWTVVPNLASYVLARIARRIRRDWEERYGHPVFLLETFVECERFRGTCYRAANWTSVGMTRGRTRNDSRHRIEVPVKEVFVYPLGRNALRTLCQPVA